MIGKHQVLNDGSPARKLKLSLSAPHAAAPTPDRSHLGRRASLSPQHRNRSSFIIAWPHCVAEAQFPHISEGILAFRHADAHEVGFSATSMPSFVVARFARPEGGSLRASADVPMTRRITV
jgi:hypothetical protein